MTHSPIAATAPFTNEARQFIALTLGGALAIAAAAHGSSSAAAPLLTMATPTLATIAISWRSKALRRIWRALGLRRAAPRHWPVALLLPAFVAATSYGMPPSQVSSPTLESILAPTRSSTERSIFSPGW